MQSEQKCKGPSMSNNLTKKFVTTVLKKLTLRFSFALHNIKLPRPENRIVIHLVLEEIIGSLGGENIPFNLYFSNLQHLDLMVNLYKKK